MEIRIYRKFKKDTYTIGKMYINGIYFCDTCEDKDRGLDQSMPETTIKKLKVYGKTAIPIGVYDVIPCAAFSRKSWSKKYNCKMPLISMTKGFVGVFVHPANTAEELLGCIAVGENKAKGKVLNSVNTFCALMDTYIVPAWKRNEKIKIIIE